jgi:hypothetical protein
VVWTTKETIGRGLCCGIKREGEEGLVNDRSVATAEYPMHRQSGSVGCEEAGLLQREEDSTA